ncbi:MAG: hypothetical protein A3C53_05965 [Omnitrophica WOR_2 bacterium RIFCSPHIGHO2_02_FULL_68_15]|nr:MAG: hypothetical protein A3C53_05965 [Omnitrophica WOR_2 bacterium RIFCSPHIGHO2_02_FULL_68_15]
MRYHQPFDEILDSRPKLQVLRFLCRKGGEWGVRRLAAEVGMNPVTAHRALRALHQATLLEHRRVGTSDCYALRDDHDLVQEILRPLFRREAEGLERLAQRLRKILGTRRRSAVVTMALYGSVARGQERPTSDLDCLVVVTSASAKSSVRQALESAWRPVMQAFGNPLALSVKTVREAQGMARRRSPLWQNILEQHRVLWGQPLAQVIRGRAA